MGEQNKFFYDTGHQLLVDAKPVAAMPGQLPGWITDDYVWLGGRPLLIVRGRIDSNGTHQSEWMTDCQVTSGADFEDTPTVCGAYAPITDHLGKPVLMLDNLGRIAGVADYDPFGRMNQVVFSGTQASTYLNGQTGQLLWEMHQPPGQGMNVRMRVQFHLVETEPPKGGLNEAADYAWLEDLDSSTALTGHISEASSWEVGRQTTAWVQPVNGHIGVKFTSDAENCCPSPYGSDADCGCAAYPNYPYRGVVPEAYEYQRYQSGATPFWTPLRFPGQYFDAETGLHENWNRYFDPARGGYLSPEPLLQSPGYVATMAGSGLSVPTYAYAANNPLRYTDPTGLDVYLVNCGGYVGHTDVVVENACYGPESNDSRGAVGGGFYCAGWPTDRHAQCAFVAPGEFRQESIYSQVGDLAGRCNSYDRLTVQHIPMSCEQTAQAYDRLRSTITSPPTYAPLANNCHDVAQSIALGPWRRCAGITCSF